MPMILTLGSRRGGMPPEARTLSDGTISIGRGTVCDWVLADPERLLSKTHCMIGVEGSRIVLTDLSTNGVFINGAREPTARDSRVFLTDGDIFRLGDYTVTCTEVEIAPAPRSAGSAGRAAAASDPFADDGEDPFGGEPGTMFRHPIPARPVKPARHDDPFAAMSHGGPARALGGDADDDLFAGLTPDPSWAGASQADNADARAHAFAPPKAVAATRFEDLDLDALLGEEPPEVAVRAKADMAAPDMAAGARAPANAAFVATPAARPAAQSAAGDRATAEGETAPGASASAPAGGQNAEHGTARLLQAFLDGAGVPGLQLGRDPDAALQAAGTVFRAMAEGLREVLMSRAAIKNELRVEQTMLQPRNNNPLKFSVTPEEAVAALLMPLRPGYLAPVATVDEACRDIQSHEMAVMAGVQTALTGLLKRFDPASLEARLQAGRLDGILPAARKARMWELFCATYATIAREAEDDFQSVFGREFARAYDAQMRKL